MILSLISVSNVNVCVQPHFLEKVVMHTTTMDRLIQCQKIVAYSKQHGKQRFQRVETYHCGS